eukprot:m.38564 g.38564  ORF g.38564 m.38564 type:complete len:376 (-) comp6809_c1_seq1:109-1236(-)
MAICEHQLGWGAAATLVVIGLVLNCSNGVLGQARCVPGKNCTATTQKLMEIFVGRCYSYEFAKGTCVDNLEVSKCVNAWTFFMEGTMPIVRNGEATFDFSKLITLVPPESLEGKTVFWSGLEFSTLLVPGEVLGQAAYYAVGRSSTALELTQLGAMANGINFCRDPQNTAEFLYSDCCPVWEDTGSSARRSFWEQVSIAFAKQARGNISILMRQPSHRDTLFSETTVLYQEISSLGQCNGCIASIFAMKTNGCRDASLNIAREILENKGFVFDCQHSGQTVENIACVLGKKTLDFCLELRAVSSGLDDGAVAGIAIACIIIGLCVAAFLYWYFKKRNLSNFLLQFKDTSEELSLMIDDPEDYNSEGYNAAYVGFE